MRDHKMVRGKLPEAEGADVKLRIVRDGVQFASFHPNSYPFLSLGCQGLQNHLMFSVFWEDPRSCSVFMAEVCC